MIVKEEFKDHFRFNMKQHGAILAKGWMMGVQFEELFKDGLYLELGRKGVAMAQVLRTCLKKRAFRFWHLHLPTRYFLSSRMPWRKP